MGMAPLAMNAPSAAGVSATIMLTVPVWPATVSAPETRTCVGFACRRSADSSENEMAGKRSAQSWLLIPVQAAHHNEMMSPAVTE